MIDETTKDIIIEVKGREFLARCDIQVEVEEAEPDTGFRGEINLFDFCPYWIMDVKRGDRLASEKFMREADTWKNRKTVEDSVREDKY